MVISEIQNITELARATGVSVELIKAYLQSQHQTSFYQKMRIPKRGRNRRDQFREVYKASEKWLSQLHRMIAIIVTRSFQFEEHVQGFLPKRSTLSNAKLHLQKRIILHADIKDFFNAITEKQVEESFISIGAAPNIAQTLARICTIDGFLLQGTRCSPIISNIVCRSLDVDMLILAKTKELTYSRYADNITLSGDLAPDQNSVRIILQKHGFQLRDNRCYEQTRGSRQYVTGLSVVDEIKPRLPKKMKQKLRLIVYFVSKFGEEHFEVPHQNSIANSMSQLHGLICYAHSIEPVFAKKLWDQLNL